MKQLMCILILATIFVRISQAQDESVEGEDDDGTEPLKLIAKANVKFARSMYSMLRSSSNDDNLVFSPSSLNILLAMLRKGTTGSTSRELRETLGLTPDLSESKITDGYSEYVQSFPDFDDIEFESVERVYVPFTHRIKRGYKNLLLEGFLRSSGVKNMDFSDGPVAVQKINSWMNDSTYGKVDSVVTEAMLSKSTKLILVSGVYFHGMWDRAFTVSNRETDVFYTNDTHNAYVTFLNQVGRFKYAELPVMNTQAVAVPFAGERLEMIILLPKDRNGLDWPLSAKLTNESLSAIPARMRKVNVRLSIPLFEMESYLSLINGGAMLQKMGLRSSLKDSADFDLISPNSGLFVDRIIQKTVFHMTERGLQPPPEPPAKYKAGREPIPFRANHPFLAYVYDTETKSVLLVVKKVK